MSTMLMTMLVMQLMVVPVLLSVMVMMIMVLLLDDVELCVVGGAWSPDGGGEGKCDGNAFTALTACTGLQYESTPPTTSSQRGCTDYTICNPSTHYFVGRHTTGGKLGDLICSTLTGPWSLFPWPWSLFLVPAMGPGPWPWSVFCTCACSPVC